MRLERHFSVMSMDTQSIWFCHWMTKQNTDHVTITVNTHSFSLVALKNTVTYDYILLCFCFKCLPCSCYSFPSLLSCNQNSSVISGCWITVLNISVLIVSIKLLLVISLSKNRFHECLRNVPHSKPNWNTILVIIPQFSSSVHLLVENQSLIMLRIEGRVN